MAQANERSETSPDETAIPSHRWVLKYGDRVYGPYSLESVKTYVAEGRVAEHSLLAPEGTPAGASMWQHAIDIPAIAALFGAPVQEEETSQAEQPAEPAEEASEESHTEAELAAPEVYEAEETVAAEPAHKLQPDKAGDRSVYGSGKGQVDRRRQPDTANFIIVMDIKARFAGPLEQAIMSLGPAYKLAPNVWCVNTDATAAGLLNDLGTHIGRTDTMFIADTTRDRTAWSSMGPEVDAKIRRVWRRTY
ncbi:hypothetical protein [Parvibaculum sp.]|uniref:hypothetical protein n=1 Tax=Parvibaculum sp. TaxID=2024848 RepID=UPI003BA982FC